MTRVILVAFGLAYLAYPSYDYYFDGLTFAMAVEGVAAGGDPGWLLHPHHLLFSPASYVIHRAAAMAGLEVRAWHLMQWVSSLTAVAGLALFHGMLARRRETAPVALAVTVLLGVSYSWWHFGTQGDTTMPVTVRIISLLSLVTRPSGPPRGAPGCLLLGALQGAAILLHQTAVLFVPAACWAIWRTAGVHRRVRLCGIFVAAAGGITVTAYLALPFMFLDISSLREFRSWLLGYFGPDFRTGYAVSYGAWGFANVGASVHGWFESLFGNWPSPGAGRLLWGSFAVLIGGTIVWHLPWSRVRSLVRSRVPKPDSGRIALEVTAIWLATHLAFFTWWKPGHARFLLLALPAWLLLVAPRLSTGLKSGRRRILAGPAFAWSLAGAVAIAVAAGPFRHESSPGCNRFLAISESLAAATSPNSVVVISGAGEYNALKAYIPYFAGRKMFILDWQFPDKSASPAQQLAELSERMNRTRRRTRMYVMSEAASRNLDSHFLKFHGISGSARRLLLASFPKRPVLDLEPGLTLYAIDPL